MIINHSCVTADIWNAGYKQWKIQQLVFTMGHNLSFKEAFTSYCEYMKDHSSVGMPKEVFFAKLAWDPALDDRMGRLGNDKSEWFLSHTSICAGYIFPISVDFFDSCSYDDV